MRYIMLLLVSIFLLIPHKTEGDAAMSRWQARFGHEAVVWRDRMYIIGGSKLNTIFASGIYSNTLTDIWTSANGQQWKCVSRNVPWNKRLNIIACAGRDSGYESLFIIGGETIGAKPSGDGFALNHCDAWQGIDAKTWTPTDIFMAVKAPCRSSTVSTKDRMFIIGGVSGEPEVCDNHIYMYEFGDSWITDGRQYSDQMGLIACDTLPL